MARDKDIDKVICTVCGQRGEFWKDETPKNEGGEYCGKECARAGLIAHTITAGMSYIGGEVHDAKFYR